jgi:hypothetical protein
MAQSLWRQSSHSETRLKEWLEMSLASALAFQAGHRSQVQQEAPGTSGSSTWRLDLLEMALKSLNQKSWGLHPLGWEKKRRHP